MLSAVLMIVMLAMLALSVDLGYILTTRVELDRATDAAALAGAGVLIDGAEGSEIEAFKFLACNSISGPVLAEEDRWVLTAEDDWQDQLALMLAEYREEHGFQVQVGQWNADADRTPVYYPENPEDPVDGRFTILDPATSDIPPSAVRVVAMHNNLPLFFGYAFQDVERIYTEDGFEDRVKPICLTSESIARYQPRDIALVLDFSGSMNDDSELRRIKEYGESSRAPVEASLLEIYEDLGSPTYGNLQFEPQYVTLVGQPASGPIPQVSVTFQENSDDVFVTSTKDLSNVVVQYTDGSKTKWEGLSGYTGVFPPPGQNPGKDIARVWVKSGSNDSGDGPGYGEKFEQSWTDDYDRIKSWFGLNSVSYPYSYANWDSFITYVRTSYNVQQAGYKKMYGHMTLINYWLEQKPQHIQTPDLWMGSAQPVKAVKDAVSVFMTYVQEVDTEDRVALAIYNSSSETALLEHSLTEDFATIQNTVNHRQAGHYDVYTNIGAGIREARLELETNARSGAFKMIVLMTDGVANKPYNSTYAKTYALDQAQLAADLHYPIVTISLGNGADTTLMQQIADVTGGVHFNVPGNETVTDYEDELLGVFRQIADDRPLVLVK